MRYLVRARVKPGREADLLAAIEQETLGQGSVAEGEYLRNMQEARLCADQTARWVEVCYCPTPLQEERSYWEAIFRSHQSAGCPRPPQMPRRKRYRALGLRRLRLHRAAGAEAECNRNTFPGLPPGQKTTSCFIRTLPANSFGFLRELAGISSRALRLMSFDFAGVQIAYAIQPPPTTTSPS